MTRDPIRDRIAIVGIGSTGYAQDNMRSTRTLAAEAAIKAIADAGLKREDIDGLVSSAGMGSPVLVPPGAAEMCAILRLPGITHFSDSNAVIGGALIDAMNAVHAGACKTALVYHYNFRSPVNSSKAAADPFRRSVPPYAKLPPENMKNAAAYAAWCSRYLYENDVKREHLGYIALNSRSNAIDNPLAAMRKPMTMDDYLNARMIRDPFCMLDMDVPVDGADAFILTTVERARDMPHRVVRINAAVQGLIDTASDEEQLASLAAHGQNVVARELWRRSDRTLADVDLAFIYEGFSFIALSWLEKLGWCESGGAGAFLQRHWDPVRNRLLIDGKIPVNSNGGMLSEGGTQGAGFVREAVHQLRGEAGPRQVGDVRTALLAIGGFFFNSQGAMLVRDD